MGVGNDGGRWYGGVYGVVAAVARCVCSHEQWWGFGTKIPKPSPGGSVLGALMETGVGNDRWGWYGGVYAVVAAAARCVRSHERWGGFGTKIPKPSPGGSVSGAPMETGVGNDIGVVVVVCSGVVCTAVGWWARGGALWGTIGGVVWWCVSGGGGGALRSLGLGPRSRNRALVARFWVRQWKQGWGTIGGGGMVVYMGWWWWRRVAFAQASGGGGLGPKT
jgi:hypothetical protein